MTAPAPTPLSEAAFREMLARVGLQLDDRAFAAAYQGARHLLAEVDRVTRYLDQTA